MPIDAKYYIHEDDLKALESLKAIPGFSQLLKTFMKEWNERQSRLRNLSSYIRIDENQLSKYYEMLPPICEKLGIEVPELYLMMSPQPNAFTSGETNPYIVLTSGLLDVLPEELIPTILAHECGHIACHHVLYRTMGTILFGGAAGTLNRIPLGSLISLPLQVAFFYWMRCSEYSADRAAVICDGTADKMAEVCMRLAGYDNKIDVPLNKEAFMAQAKEYKQITSDSKWNKTLEFYLLSGATHPFMALRALECTDWQASQQYQHIMDGTYTQYEPTIIKQEKETTDTPEPSNFWKMLFPTSQTKEETELVCKNCGTVNPSDAHFCKTCGEPLTKTTECPNCHSTLEGDEKFCPHCGTKLS